MRPRTRRRRWPFWTCLAATAIVVALTGLSSHWVLARSSFNGTIERNAMIGYGGAWWGEQDLAATIQAGGTRLPGDTGWQLMPQWRLTLYWTPRWNAIGPYPNFVPFWPLAVVLSGLMLGLYVRLRWALPGHCRCGYDLTGVAGPCPECGRARPGGDGT